MGFTALFSVLIALNLTLAFEHLVDLGKKGVYSSYTPTASRCPGVGQFVRVACHCLVYFLAVVSPREETHAMANFNLKKAARELIDKLPDDATWDDVVYEMVVRREIEAGLADSEANRTTPVEDVAKEFGLKA